MEFIDLHEQYKRLKKEIDAGINEVINSTHFISGQKVKDLESRLKEYVGAKYCLTCANGTDALTLSLRALDISSGDAVFVADFTYFASAEVIALEGATPVFVDVDETFNIDCESLKNAIASVRDEGKLKPKAIIVVDLFGQPANYPEIRKIANMYNLKIIEDGAQGFGGSINGKMACSFGDISTTSFFPVKPLGCYGDGGAVFTDDENYYKLMSSLAVHGKGEDKYDNVRIGYNSRLDTIQAAILLPKLEALKNNELVLRNKVADKYIKSLKNIFITPLVLEGFNSSWAQFSLLAIDEEHRNYVMDFLKSKDIPTMIYYRNPMHCQKAFQNNKLYVNLPKSESFMKRIFSIPMHPYLEQETQDFIIRTLIEANDNYFKNRR